MTATSQYEFVGGVYGYAADPEYWAARRDLCRQDSAEPPGVAALRRLRAIECLRDVEARHGGMRGNVVHLGYADEVFADYVAAVREEARKARAALDDVRARIATLKRLAAEGLISADEARQGIDKLRAS